AAIGMQSEESNSIQKMISDLEAERANTSAPSTSILRSKERTPGTQIGFIFNIPLAEQVAPGNYINATESADSGNFTAVFGTDMTDIFGNVLQEKWTYIPLVLTVSNDVEQDLSQYKSNWSGYATATIYTYHESGFTPASQPTK
ncbi:MAG TPA: hypothetical protein VFU15_01485, partial [Bacteroidia bacterium]|nr:hypothetical protein [Bacteroidia bacterium]